MAIIRVTIYLKSNTGPKPFRTCYLAEQELDRLMGDFKQYQTTGEPKDGAYFEEVGANGDQAVFLEFDSIAQIKTSG